MVEQQPSKLNTRIRFPSPAPPSNARTVAIDFALEHAVASGALPCIVAMAADRSGLIYAGAFGEKTIGTGDSAGFDTIFRLHSMTKAVTAVAAMQLVEQARLSLDQPIATLLPDLAQPAVLTGFDDHGAPVLEPAHTPITLRMLLTHTAGFSYDIWNENTLAYQMRTGHPGPFSGKRAALNQPLAFEPGTRWHYSIAIDWVGLAVEAASGLDLETYCRRHIFGPLGMTDTAFVQTEAQRARRAAMHKRQADGSIAPVILDRPDQTEYHVGGGGLFGTVPDFLAFTSALLADGGGLVKPETMALMARNQIAPLIVEPMVTCLPNLSETCEFWPGTAKGWGLSFLLNSETTPEGRAAGSLAWAGLSNLFFWVDPTKGITGVFASQMLPFFDSRAVETFRTFERAIYGGNPSA